jgi:hypothetical protein
MYILFIGTLPILIACAINFYTITIAICCCTVSVSHSQLFSNTTSHYYRCHQLHSLSTAIRLSELPSFTLKPTTPHLPAAPTSAADATTTTAAASPVLLHSETLSRSAGRSIYAPLHSPQVCLGQYQSPSVTSRYYQLYHSPQVCLGFSLASPLKERERERDVYY